MKILILFIVIIILGGLGFFYFGVQDTSVESFVLDGISAISVDSFTVTGVVNVDNPSSGNVPIKAITYDIVLVETDEIIGSGSIDSFILKPGTNAIPLSQEVRWSPTADFVTSLILEDEVEIEVVGEVLISSFTLPFSSTTDIKEYITQFVPVEGVSNPAVTDVANGLLG